ncbi:MAG: hypothetical protein ABFE08_21540 [Armatimonadia bacterium]
MQDRYVGDIGDFGKYGLLRFMAGYGFRLGIVWYLNPDEESNSDGSLTDYFSPVRHSLRDCDPRLYDALDTLVNDRDRTVAGVREREILPAGTSFYESPLSFGGMPVAGGKARQMRLARRQQWLEAALDETREADLVFLDPDNGLGGKSAKPHVNKGQKFAFVSEVGGWLERGQTVIVYHHSGRQRGGMSALAADWLARLHQETAAARGWALGYHRQTARLYFVLAHADHSPFLTAAMSQLLTGPWGTNGHFSLQCEF